VQGRKGEVAAETPTKKKPKSISKKKTEEVKKTADQQKGG